MKKKIKNIIIISLLCFLCFFIFGIGSQTTESDSGHYINGAVNLLEDGEFAIEKGVLTNYREPGYSFFLAGVFSVFGKDNLLAVKFCQFFLFVLFLVYANSVLNKYFRNKKIVFLVVLLFAMFPSFSYYMGVMLSEAIFIPLFGFLILLLMDIYFSKFTKVNKKIFLLSVLLGLLMLIKVSTFLIVFLMVIFFLFHKKYKQAFIVLVVSYLIITPWMIRNYNQFGEFGMTAGRQEGLFFASGHMIRNSSPNDFLRRTVLRFKKGFQMELSQEEKDFVFYHNENEVAHGDLQYIKKEYLENNPGVTEKDFSKYLFVGIINNPLSGISQIGLNLAGTLGPEIPRVLKNNKFTEGRGAIKKFFYGSYLLFHVAVYFICFLFLIKILKFKKEYGLFYLFFIIPLVVLSGYSLVIISNRYNTPFFIFYFLMIGFYFDYKYKEKSLETK